MGVDLMGGHHEFYHVISATDDITQCNLLIHEMSRMCPGGNCHNMQRSCNIQLHARARTVPSNPIIEGFEFCSLICSHGRCCAQNHSQY